MLSSLSQRISILMIISVYLFFSLVIAINAIFEGWGWDTGFFILGSSVLSAFAGSGMRGSLYSGIGVVFGGLVMALIFMSLAQWLGTMYSVGFFGHQFSGHGWSGIGFIVGFLFTPKRFIEDRRTF